MKKQNYEAPVTEMVKIAIEQTLLDGSFNAGRQSYGAAQTDTWGED